MKRTSALAMLVLLVNSVTHAQAEPWSPSPKCTVKARGTDGLHPDPRSALGKAGVDHRITRSLDRDVSPANYHGPDVTLGGSQFTAAVDISVRCLDETAIKQLLGNLAMFGFAAWYRKDGKDSWKGSNHIHAVWAAEPLKRQLQRQVASWLAGRTGLVGDAPYRFWQPTTEERMAVQTAYEKSKAAK